MAKVASVFVKRPQVSAVFHVRCEPTDEGQGRIEGVELERLAKFLRGSDGIPQFDMEYDGRQYNNCRLTGEALTDTITFSFESVASFERDKSDPNASYR